jgi:hypothetical protein
MNKKIVVLGRGTAGSQAIAHFVRWFENCEIEWHFDPNIPTQSVGEGSVLSFPRNMFENFGFSFEDLKHVDGTLKTGIQKMGWGKNGKNFFHDFPPPSVSFHFNAVKLQDYILNKFKGKIKVVEHNITSDQIDANYVMDCSGKPKTYENFNIPKYIPVNSVHVNQCWWDYPRFQHTLTFARPYGWIFGIPLQNRCSIGYLYNNNINSLDEVKEDILKVIESLNLTPSDTTNTFSFGNYLRKRNFTENIAYNGNASFFLEPLEATSVGVMDLIQRTAFDLWNNTITIDHANETYMNFMEETENIIMMHYFSGSIYNTEFWKYAKAKGKECMKNALANPKFKFMCDSSNNIPHIGMLSKPDNELQHYSVWWLGSFLQNISGLDIREDLLELSK